MSCRTFALCDLEYSNVFLDFFKCCLQAVSEKLCLTNHSQFLPSKCMQEMNFQAKSN